MKCSKCGYLGFEPAERCRHCGYDFSLLADTPLPPARVAEPSRTSAPLATGAAADIARTPPLIDLPLTSEPVAPAQAAALAATLFADPQPPPARTPLAVRRTAERPRSRATTQVVRRRADVLDRQAGADPLTTAAPGDDVAAAPAVARVCSAAIDVALLAAIDVAVIYLTAQMAGVPVAESATLPMAPLAAFVFGLNVAYLAVFTANGGQTLGKMALGLKVESTDGELTFGGAVVRVAATLVGGLAFGAGFVPALWRADRRAIHDHLAHTRVVKVGA